MSLTPISLTRRLGSEGVGSLLLTATVVGSGIMAARLSGGNAAVALLANTGATVAVLAALIALLGWVRERRAFQLRRLLHTSVAGKIKLDRRGSLSADSDTRMLRGRFTCASYVRSPLMAGLGAYSHRTRAMVGGGGCDLRVAIGGARPPTHRGCCLDGGMLDRSGRLVYRLHFICEPRDHHCSIAHQYVLWDSPNRCAGLHRGPARWRTSSMDVSAIYVSHDEDLSPAVISSR